MVGIRGQVLFRFVFIYLISALVSFHSLSSSDFRYVVLSFLVSASVSRSSRLFSVRVLFYPSVVLDC